MTIQKTSVLIVVLISLLGCTNDKETFDKEVIRPVKHFIVGETQKHTMRKFPGEAKAATAVTLAFEVTGKLNEFPIEVGDRVNAGQILAALDPRDYKSALEQATAAVMRAEARLTRLENALLDDAVSQQEITDAKADYNTAKSTKQIREKALEDTVLRAPFNGIVVAKYTDNFSNINAKQQVVRLIDPNKIEMTADISEDIISLVHEGMDISVQFDSFPDRVISAVVNEVGAEASQVTGTFPVTLIFEQSLENPILPGMTGKAWRKETDQLDRLPTALRGFEVPISAIVNIAKGQHFIWVVSDDMTVSQVPVDLGELTKTGVLVQGLNGGETIVSAGVNLLQEGQKIRLLN